MKKLAILLLLFLFVIGCEESITITEMSLGMNKLTVLSEIDRPELQEETTKYSVYSGRARTEGWHREWYLFTFDSNDVLVEKERWHYPDYIRSLESASRKSDWENRQQQQLQQIQWQLEQMEHKASFDRMQRGGLP